MVTGTGERRTTPSATLPSNNRETPWRPVLPMTTWSMSSFSIVSTIVRTGCPTSTCPSTSMSCVLASASISSNSDSASSRRCSYHPSGKLGIVASEPKPASAGLMTWTRTRVPSGNSSNAISAALCANSESSTGSSIRVLMCNCQQVRT